MHFGSTPTYRTGKAVTGFWRYFFGLLFILFSIACISAVFYLIEQASHWAERPYVEAKPPPPLEIKQFKLGQRNFFNALLEEGLTRQDANSIVASLKRVEFDFGALRPSQKITVKWDHRKVPVRFYYRVGKILGFSAKRLPDGTYEAKRKELPTRRQQVTLAGVVESTVWKAIIDMGEMSTLTAKFIEIFGWDIDFSSDTQRGDTFVLVLEKIETMQGEPVGYGKLYAGQYNGKTVGLKQGFYFDHPVEKKKGFYTIKGQQMKKFMLRAPLDTLRVTSRFGFRMHPTLRKRKRHNGIDYGAPTGTPIWAVADGTIVSAGYHGAAGKMVAIDHANGLKSYYMHLSRVNVRKGQKVGQRKMIGRVGSTGRSTGPHLHFGLKYKGQWVNPTKRNFGKVENLEAKYMDELKKTAEQYKPLLEQGAAGIVPLPPEKTEEPTPSELEKPYS